MDVEGEVEGEGDGLEGVEIRDILSMERETQCYCK